MPVGLGRSEGEKEKKNGTTHIQTDTTDENTSALRSGTTNMGASSSNDLTTSASERPNEDSMTCLCCSKRSELDERGKASRYQSQDMTKNKKSLKERSDEHSLLLTPTASKPRFKVVLSPSVLASFSSKPGVASEFKPAWKKDPEPLIGWTKAEQRIVIETLEQHPECRKNAEIRDKQLESIRRLLPGKSFEQVQSCFQHVDKQRISYFQASTKQQIRKKSS